MLLINTLIFLKKNVSIILYTNYSWLCRVEGCAGGSCSPGSSPACGSDKVAAATTTSSWAGAEAFAPPPPTHVLSRARGCPRCKLGREPRPGSTASVRRIFAQQRHVRCSREQAADSVVAHPCAGPAIDPSIAPKTLDQFAALGGDRVGSQTPHSPSKTETAAAPAARLER